MNLVEGRLFTLYQPLYQLKILLRARRGQGREVNISYYLDEEKPYQEIQLLKEPTNYQNSQLR
jgi:hypothetical protein